MYNNRPWGTLWRAVLLSISVLLLTRCSDISDTESKISGAPTDTGPAEISKMADSEFNRVTLSDKAFQRLGIETATVREVSVNGRLRVVIPYGALIYGLNGETWAYTSPTPRTFVRQLITVEQIEGDMVFLSNSPAVGTAVATVGVAELYGADTGIGK